MATISIKRTKTTQALALQNHRVNDLVRNLLFEFVSNLKQQTIEMSNAEFPIEILYIIENTTEISDAVRNDSTKNTVVLCKIEEKDVIINFKSYWYNDQYLYNEVTIVSPELFNFTDNSLFEYFLENAIYHSEFKGAYINIDGEDIQNFYAHELPERTFDDIYLPAKMIQDLKAYTAVFEKRQRIMRYMFVGAPGSGKTESLIVIANALKAQGVTVLKVSAAGLRNAVKFANILAPSLIVLDDIDLELGNRDDYNQTVYLKSFLDILDGVEKISPNVGVLATTNSLWLVDTAAQRPGRFNKIMSFGELTKENIINIIKKSLNAIEMPEMKVLYDAKLVEHYDTTKQTGAYIFNMTQMLANQIDIDMVKPNVKDILSYMKDDSDLLASLKEGNGAIY
jgi:hypothetical protein